MNNFFNKPTDLSKVKLKIVSDYFNAWSDIMKKRADKIGYIDLYSGPGIYSDGTESIPIKIMKRILEEKTLRNKSVTFFNDKNAKFMNQLKNNIMKMKKINQLDHKPIFKSEEINQDFTVFEDINMIPTLSFLDPWGYKGLNYKLIKSLSCNWGCDLIFFFNYNRINAGLNNPKVDEHIDAIFQPHIAEELRDSTEGLSPNEREDLIIDTFEKELPCKCSQSFQFIDENRNRTSHYLLFITDNSVGLKIMKDIMGGLSSSKKDGIPKYTYHPKNEKLNQLPLIEYNSPFEQLKEDLIDKYSGKKIIFNSLFLEHHISTNGTERNYKDAILELESDGLVKCKPPMNDRRLYKGKPSLPNDTVIIFP